MILNLNVNVEWLMFLIYGWCFVLYRCSYDYLNVYDGLNIGVKLIDKFCGYWILNILLFG